MGYQVVWDASYKSNPGFSLQYTTWSIGGFYKVSDDILTEEDLIGQTVIYRTGYRGKDWTEWKVDKITGCSYIESGAKKVLEVPNILFSGPAGEYCVWEHPLGSTLSVFARLTEPGTYIRRSSGDDSDLQVQSIGLYDEFEIDWGYTDYGEGDSLNKNPLKRILQGGSIAGAFRCQTYNTKGDEELRFRWYENGENLVKEDAYSTRKYSDFVPSTDVLGINRYYCIVDSVSLLSYKTDRMVVEVIPPPVSDRIPIDQSHRYAMIQGWFTGRRLAAMRGKIRPVADTARLGLATLGRMILGKE